MPNAEADQQRPEIVLSSPIVKEGEEGQQQQQQQAQQHETMLTIEGQQNGIVTPVPPYKFCFKRRVSSAEEMYNLVSSLESQSLKSIPAVCGFLNVAITDQSQHYGTRLHHDPALRQRDECIMEHLHTTQYSTAFWLDCINQVLAVATAKHTQEIEKLKADHREECSQKLEKIEIDLCAEHSKRLNDQLKISEEQIEYLKLEKRMLEVETQNAAKLNDEILKIMKMKAVYTTGQVTLMDDDSVVEEQPEIQNISDELSVEEKNARNENEIKKHQDHLIYLYQYYGNRVKESRAQTENWFCEQLKDELAKFKDTLVKHEKMYKLDRDDWGLEKEKLEKRVTNVSKELSVLKVLQKQQEEKLKEMAGLFGLSVEANKENNEEEEENSPTHFQEMKEKLTNLEEDLSVKLALIDKQKEHIVGMEVASASFRNAMKDKLHEEHVQELLEQKKAFERQMQELEEKLRKANEKQNAKTNELPPLNITKRKSHEVSVQDDGKRRKMAE